jgi:HSP20 family molecular chaperone IbpA
MHEYKPAGPCHGRGFRHPRGQSDRRPERDLAKDARCVPKYDREVTPEQTSHEEVRETTAATGRTMRPQSVPVNVYEAPEALIVVAPFPAVTLDDVTIELSPAILRISARLRSSGPREYLLREWEYGGYEREIDLPEGYGSRVEASLTNGQLVVRVLRGPLADPLSMQPS